MGWPTFWATFSQTHLVTLVANKFSKGLQAKGLFSKQPFSSYQESSSIWSGPSAVYFQLLDSFIQYFFVIQMQALRINVECRNAESFENVEFV
jgi:hypothetical protein